MAVSSQDILNFLLANPGMSDSAIAAAMDMGDIVPGNTPMREIPEMGQ